MTSEDLHRILTKLNEVKSQSEKRLEIIRKGMTKNDIEFVTCDKVIKKTIITLKRLTWKMLSL
jgi:hypothetical protein